MLKLFAVHLGGRAKGCNIELHDTVFIIGNTIEETYPKLISKWFGTHKGLHIDSYMELKYVDGYEIKLSKERPAENNKTLFFVNFGGYKPNYFGEIHQVNFFVADSKADATKRAKTELCVGLSEQHCDDNLIIDDLKAIDHVNNYYIHLQETTQPANFNITSKYIRLDVPKIKAAYVRMAPRMEQT